MVRLALGQLFQTSMEEADVRRGLDHDLTVQFQNDPQHPVRTRMLGSHIEDHRLSSWPSLILLHRQGGLDQPLSG